MRRMKRLLAVLLAAVMVMTMGSMSVMADDANDGEYIITITGVDTDEHTFAAYQIFSGFVSGGVISNVLWGSAIDIYDSYTNSMVYTINSTKEAALYTALAALEVDGDYPFASVSSAAEVAEVLEDAANDSDLALAFAALIVNYLADDATATANSSNATAVTTSDGTTYTYTFTDLEAGYYLVLDATSTSDNSSSAYTQYMLITAGGDSTSYNVASVKTSYPTVSKAVSDPNAAVGDTVTFTLTGTVPDMTYYDTYTYKFTDTLSDGLTYTDSSLTVYAYTDDTSVPGVELDDVTGQTDTSGGYTLSVSGGVITVSFSDLKTVVGSNAYTTIVVTYDATLNENAELGTTSTSSANTNKVYITYSNDPNWDSTSLTTEPTGKTTEEIVYVNTYELYVTKYDESTGILEGAIFCLYYLDSNGATQYALLDDDGQITGWTTTQTLGDDTEITTDANGILTISGLDAGVTYYLKELSAPAGYNLLSDPIEFTITATNDENGLLKTLSVDVVNSTSSGNASGTAASSTGIVSISVHNYEGSTLPTTGGIGTTIFYVVGAVLVIGAAVILITRRRMASRT